MSYPSHPASKNPRSRPESSGRPPDATSLPSCQDSSATSRLRPAPSTEVVSLQPSPPRVDPRCRRASESTSGRRDPRLRKESLLPRSQILQPSPRSPAASSRSPAPPPPQSSADSSHKTQTPPRPPRPQPPPAHPPN